MAADGGVLAVSSMETPSWAVRLRGADGEIAGAGILLSADHVLTCAHVVGGAGAVLTAEFVGAPGHGVPAVLARVDGDAYVPEALDEDGDPGGDVALLRLEKSRPPGDAVRLHRLSAPDRRVRMYGFPLDHNGGIWFRATVVGGCGRDGQVQMSPASPGEVASPGCSGAGVADSLTGEVIGMVLSGQRDQHGNLYSYMTPAETIVRHLPGVEAYTVGRAAVDARLRSTEDDAARELFDERFAQRLADWLQDDGTPLKISVVGHDDDARAATLRRAVTLADRELRTAVSVGRTFLEPPGTVPSAGDHDLALHAGGLASAEIAERIAERMGLWQHTGESPADCIRTAKVTLTLVVVGVDEALDPPALLELLDVLRAGGSRLLLVFRTDGEHHRQACRLLLDRPARERRDRLVERLREITGPLAAAVFERRSTVVPEKVPPLDADLVAVHAALFDLLRARAPGGGPDPARYERLADRVSARLTGHLRHLDLLAARRDELTGRLRSYHVLHQHATRGAEDPAVDELYLRAHSLLRATPCDVRAAEAAVDDFTHRVDAGGEAGSGPDDGGAGSGPDDRYTGSGADCGTGYGAVSPYRDGGRPE
ncbi:serine protease [Streptomyces sp. NBC_00102]|uniref:S1 family peptidase n=1 Tax=Streptomyces sp. NBC_00102 TaxID=2975652 RepID=UPI002255155E|nr:serine protease [Streptomyces sp. NBC_00102]MCX5397208.1 serine protease [Streptomyces sp. NBC_00102]